MNGVARAGIAVLISGRGSNMHALAEASACGTLGAPIACVIADRPAAGIESAAALGLPTTVVPALGRERSVFEQALREAIEASGARLVALAGFMRVLSPAFVAQFEGRLVNIHPSLLPKFKGLHTHQRALDAHEREHGATVHFVSAELDGGPALAQTRVPVRDDDDEATLAARVLRAEHRLYPQALDWIVRGRVRLDHGTVLLDGAPLAQPLTVSDVTA